MLSTRFLLAATLALAAGMPFTGNAQEPSPTPAQPLPFGAAQPSGPMEPAGPPMNPMAGGMGGGSEYMVYDDPVNRFNVWGSADFLMWWTQGSHVPALVNTADPGTPRNSLGVPIAAVNGQPTTHTLYGNGQVGQNMQTGGRVTFGKWIDPEQTAGVGLRYYALAGGGSTGSFTSVAGAPIIGLPFFNEGIGFEDALLVGYPNVSEGTVTVEQKLDFTAAEAFGRLMMEQSGSGRVDLIAGYHFARLDDRIQMNSLINGLGGLAGTTFDIQDRFKTTNEFHGGQIGLLGERHSGRVSLNGLAKVSFGSNHQTVDISGRQIITAGVSPPTNVNGGLYAQGTNIGSYNRDRFTAIPEINANLVFHCTRRFDFTMGYTGILLTNVLVAGDQIDHNVNLSQQSGPLVGPARPAFQFNDRSYWIQGMNFGVNFTF